MLALYALLIFSPNLILLYRDPGPIPFVRGILVSGLLFAAVFAIFRKHLWIAALLFLPFAILAPAESLYLLVYNRPSDANVLATIFESNLREASQYLEPAKFYVAAGLALSLPLAVVTVVALKRSGLTWQHRSALWIIAITAGLPAATMLIAAWRGVYDGSGIGQSVADSWQKLALETYATYPFGVPDRFIEYRHQWKAIREASVALGGFRFNAHPLRALDLRQVYVLVIGEASRRDHWSLYGYGRETNPELRQRPNLVVVSDMVSSWTDSRHAVPMIITRKPAQDSNVFYKEPSLSRVFQEAGFQTFWYSTQVAVGLYDSPISVAAFDAMHVRFFTPAGYTDENQHDDALLGPLRTAIQETKGNLFIVLHTTGSHTTYSLRYPPEFDRFKPSTIADAMTQPTAEIYQNAYDNSVLFTDHVLNSVIGLLQNSAAAATLFYVSDHGEMLPDATCPLIGHGFPGLPVFLVPSLFWYSDSWAREFPLQLAALKQNSSKLATTGNVFESLVDMAGLDFPGHERHRSLFDSTFVPSRRFVQADSIVDFDRKIVLPKCQEVTSEPP